MLKLSDSTLIINTILGFSLLLGWGEKCLSDDFGQAALYYQEGKFLEAAQLYEQGLSGGHKNSSVLFNIGNSYYKANRLGDAMAAYLAASSLAPRDPDIKANLSFVKNKLKNKASVENNTLDSWLGMSDVLNRKEVFFIAVALSILGSLLISSSMIWNRSFLSAGALAFGISWLFIFSFWYRTSQDQHWGAVNKAVVNVFAGPSDKNSVVVFKLYEGIPVKLVETQGLWSAIELQDKKRGWVKSSQVRFY